MTTKNNTFLPLEMQLRGALTDEQIENRVAPFVISSEAVDTYGTVFKIAGCDLKRYQKNPIVLYAHKRNDDNPDNIIGRGNVFVEGDKLIGEVTFEPEEINPKAEKCFQKVQNGTLNAASIGAMPKVARWGDQDKGEDPDILYFHEWELLEFSLVPIGANPDAIKRAADYVDSIKEATEKPEERDDQTGTTKTQEKKPLSLREAQLLINKNQIA